MAKQLSVGEWQQRIRNGQRFQQTFAQSNDWARYKEYYRHRFRPGTLPVNMMFSLLRSMVPQIYFRNPQVVITARKPGLLPELNARIVQTIDNWLLRELVVKPEMKKMVVDNFFCGIGNGVFGYDSEFGWQSAPQQFSLSQFDQKGDRIEFNSSLRAGFPWFLRARPEDIVFPWGCSSIKNAEWFAMRVFRPLADIKADAKYKNNKISDLGGMFVQKRSQPEGAATTDPVEQYGLEGDQEWAELWEIHDGRTGEVRVITMNYNKYLREDTDDLQIDGLPLETVCFNEDPDYIYGVPDARIVEPQLLELIDIRTQAQKHRRLDIVKMLMKRGVIKDQEISKMTSADVQAVINVDTEGSLADAIQPMNMGISGILQDLGYMGELVRGDVRESVGFSRNAGGEYQGKSHVSAEETKQVFRSLNIRLDERRDMMADSLSGIVRRFNQIIFTKWTAERVAQVIGPDGAKWWLKFSGPQIKDEYDLHVEPEEGPPLDSETKFEMGMRAAEVWAKMNQGAVAQGAPVPAEIQRMVFGQFQGLDIDRLLAQSKAVSSNLQQQMQGAMGAMGQSPEQPVSPQLLAQVAQGGRP